MNYTTVLDRIDDLVTKSEWPDAESLILKARTRFGLDDAALNRRHAQVLIHINEDDKAWPILEAHADNDLEINLWRCLTAYRTGQPGIARECLENILSEARPEDADGLMELSQDLYLSNQFDSSSRILRHILNMEPEDPDNLYELHIGLALCEWVLQSGQEHDHAAAALKARPGDPLAMSLLGNALYDRGHREEGLALLDRIGVERLLQLQCEEGAKRLFRWRRRQSSDRDELQRLTRNMVDWEEAHRWNPGQSSWVEDCRNRVDHSSFLIDDPDSGRLVGFSHDPGVSNRPLVNFSVCDRLRLRALEERGYLGIPVQINKSIVERWYDHVGDKVVSEPQESFWELIEITSAVN